MALVGVKLGKIDLKRANYLTFIGYSLLRANEVSDLEDKILALEAEQQDGHSDDRTIYLKVGGCNNETT